MLSVEFEDQASGLRRLFGAAAPLRACALFGPDASLRAVAAANLAHALARRGERVLVIDEAEAPRNVASQFGASPRWRLGDVVQGRCRLGQALHELPEGVQVLLASGAQELCARLGEGEWSRFLDAVLDLDEAPTCVLINAPLGEPAPSLACAAQDRLLVVPDRKSVITETYAVLKAVHQMYPDGRWHVLAMNSAPNRSEPAVFAVLASTARRFLELDLELAGALPKDERLTQAMRAMRPVLEVAPNSPVGQAFRQLADRVSSWSVPSLDIRQFWQRLYLSSRLAAEARGRGVPNAGFGRKCA